MAGGHRGGHGVIVLYKYLWNSKMLDYEVEPIHEAGADVHR